MTQEAVNKLVKALAIISILVGGFGSMICLPSALCGSWRIAAATGIYFIAGGIMIVGGLISFSIMTKKA